MNFSTATGWLMLKCGPRAAVPRHTHSLMPLAIRNFLSPECPLARHTMAEALPDISQFIHARHNHNLAPHDRGGTLKENLNG